MKKNILAQTNIFVCSIILVGFVLTSYISYNSNMDFFEEDIAHVSNLASEGIFYRIKLIFAEPVNVSLTMANDSLLKDFLTNENSMLEDEEFIHRMREYLYAYHKKYNYDSVFLASAQTNRYYHINGLDRVLTADNPENEWYYNFLKSSDDYSLNVDNDEAANNEITVFINCKIRSADGAVLGIVGVGFRVNSLQSLLQKYEEEFGVKTWLVDNNGIVEISLQKTGYERVSWFAGEFSAVPEEKILKNRDAIEPFWMDTPSGRSHVTARYVENLNWHLIVQNSTSLLSSHFNKQALQNILIVLAIILIVLYTITRVIRQYNQKIIALTAEQQRAYYEKRQETIQQLYENVYELDITNNCAVGEHTKQYFKSLGFSENTPFDMALRLVAEKQIKEEFRQGYIDTFLPSNVLQAYNNGIKTLSYECIAVKDDVYYWMRIMARVYFMSEKQALHMITYRQNIDEEKKHEKKLIAQLQSDPLTGLYNKAATEEMISEVLAMANTEELYAFFILDIDNFKTVNDTLGHAAGDFVISSFAHALKGQFRDSDIVGRIGGDEFVVFLKASSVKFIEQKAQLLVETLHREVANDTWSHAISTSLGVAIFPAHGETFSILYKNADAALYQAKHRGKNSYAIFAASLPAC